MGQLSVAVVTVTPFQQNCTLIWDNETMEGIVIDPGGEVDRIKQAIEEVGLKLSNIILTHGHIDHAGGAEALKKAYDVKIIGPHKDDQELLEGIEKQAEMFGVSGEFQNAYPDQWLEEGDSIEFGEHRFDVLHCPGHAPGHIVLINHQAKFAHVGDVLFNGSIGRTDLPGGNHDALIDSIKTKLMILHDDFSFICGHGQPSTIGQERDNNPFLQ